MLTLQSQVEFLLTINLRNYLDLKELKKKRPNHKFEYVKAYYFLHMMY